MQSSMYHYNWQLTIRWFVFPTIYFALVSFPSILHIDLISPSFLQANSKGTLAALIHLSIYVGEMLLSISPNPNLLNILEIVQRLPPESHSAIICALYIAICRWGWSIRKLSKFIWYGIFVFRKKNVRIGLN